MPRPAGTRPLGRLRDNFVFMAKTRVIKKYPNRRLYDTEISSYITIEDVRQLVIGIEVAHGTSARLRRDHSAGRASRPTAFIPRRPRYSSAAITLPKDPSP